jgi:hypothetical protein
MTAPLTPPALAADAAATPLHPADAALGPPPPERGPRPGIEPGLPWTLRGALRALLALRLPRARAQALLNARRAAPLPLALFLGAFCIYALFSWNRFTEPSKETHFAYLAHSLFQGQLELLIPPHEFYEPHYNDWASYIDLPLKGPDQQTLQGFFLPDYHLQGTPYAHREFRGLDGKTYFIRDADIDHARKPNITRTLPGGRTYTTRDFRTHYHMSFPPVPSVLMMPIIALSDPADIDLRDPTKLGINDVQFTVFFAALNVMLCFLVLEHLRALGVSGRTRRQNLWLTLAYGFCTNTLWCSILGQVWFTALIIGMTFTWLYIWASADTRHPFLAGLCLLGALGTRTPLAFSVVFFAYFLFFPDGKLRRADWASFLRKAAWFSLPLLTGGALLMWMNYARFLSPFEFGHKYLAQGLRPSTLNYGLFNYHFLSKNLHTAFSLLPRIQPYKPHVLISNHGMSLFLTSPFFLYLLSYRSGPRPIDRKWLWACTLALACVAIPGFFYQNTGWVQFGFRFSLDYTPYILLLLTFNRRPLTYTFAALAALGFFVNSFGAITFGRQKQYYEEWLIDPDTPRQPQP